MVKKSRNKEPDEDVVSAIQSGVALAFQAMETKLKPRTETFHACALNALDELRKAGFKVVKNA